MDNLPSPSELMPVVVESLHKFGGRAHIRQIEQYVAETLGLDEASITKKRHGNRTEFAYRLSWARTAAKSKGLILKELNGYWSIVH
jgi:restriction endonuclease Mrr